MKNGKEILCLVLGILLGIAGTVFGGILYLRTHLIREYSLGTMEFSRLAAEIPSAARSVEGWSATAAGCALPRPADGSPLQSFRFCNPNYAGELIRNESERKIAAILPCGIAFYTKSDGQVYASKLNLPLLGRILGGNAALLFPRNIEPDQLVILERAAKKTSK